MDEVYQHVERWNGKAGRKQGNHGNLGLVPRNRFKFMHSKKSRSAPFQNKIQVTVMIDLYAGKESDLPTCFT